MKYNVNIKLYYIPLYFHVREVCALLSDRGPDNRNSWGGDQESQGVMNLPITHIKLYYIPDKAMRKWFLTKNNIHVPDQEIRTQ